jgi:hypothetical protein
MMQANTYFCSSRRDFLKGVFPVGAFFCLGCGPILAKTGGSETQAEPTPEHKFLEKTAMNYQETFDFAYKIYLIPLLKSMAEDIGKEKFIESLKSYGTKVTFIQQTREMWNTLLNSIFWTQVLTREIIEESDMILKYNVIECLWAKTFREAEASDIGYALFCHPDFARARVAHRKLQRTKTLMQGDDCCDFFFELEYMPDTMGIGG